MKTSFGEDKFSKVKSSKKQLNSFIERSTKPSFMLSNDASPGLNEKPIKSSTTTPDLKLESIEYFLLLIFAFSIMAILLIMFAPSTLFAISLVIGSTLLFLRSRLSKFRRFGIVNLLPRGFRYLLLNKSILDILMDFWHLPNLSEYIKLLIYPIIYGYTPEQSLEAVKTLDSEWQIVLKTKVSKISDLNIIIILLIMEINIYIYI